MARPKRFPLRRSAAPRFWKKPGIRPTKEKEYASDGPSRESRSGSSGSTTGRSPSGPTTWSNPTGRSVRSSFPAPWSRVSTITVLKRLPCPRSPTQRGRRFFTGWAIWDIATTAVASGSAAASRTGLFLPIPRFLPSAARGFSTSIPQWRGRRLSACRAHGVIRRCSAWNPPAGSRVSSRSVCGWSFWTEVHFSPRLGRSPRSFFILPFPSTFATTPRFFGRSWPSGPRGTCTDGERQQADSGHRRRWVSGLGDRPDVARSRHGCPFSCAKPLSGARRAWSGAASRRRGRPRGSRPGDGWLLGRLSRGGSGGALGPLCRLLPRQRGGNADGDRGLPAEWGAPLDLYQLSQRRLHGRRPGRRRREHPLRAAV